MPLEASGALTLAGTRRIVVATLRKLLCSGQAIGPKAGDDIMSMAASDIERLIRARIPDAEVTIRDLAGDGDHYAATVIAESFRGKSRVQQHQIVYEALKGEMGGKLHALALQTGTPER